MSLSYMAEPPQPPRGVADPVLAPLIELAALAAGTWYVDALAVYSAYRGRQAGRLLMEAEIARADGRAMSLITEDDNARALALYASLGFREAARRDCVKFKPAQTTRAFVLLKRPATL
jgi:ribosomal protein S18 acetylase RimI-like enzyme